MLDLKVIGVKLAKLSLNNLFELFVHNLCLVLFHCFTPTIFIITHTRPQTHTHTHTHTHKHTHIHTCIYNIYYIYIYIYIICIYICMYTD